MFLIFSIVIFILFIYGVRYTPNNNADYVGKNQANAIKGLFILFLTVGHIVMLVLNANDLYPQTGIGNKIEMFLHQRVSQLVVVMFLFFSGYGISENIKKSVQTTDGGGYIKSIPRRRVLNTWVNYAVGIAIYMVFSPLIGKPFYWEDILQYFTCQKSIGGPTWYIFVIILCYLSTWVAASLFKNKISLVISHTLIITLTGVILSLFKDEWWYDTIICYAFGFLYSQYKNTIEQFILKKWSVSLLLTFVLFVITYHLKQRQLMPHIISFNLLSVCMAMFIVVLSMKVVFGNKAINWCGAHLFPIYMYQGLVYLLIFNIGGESHTLAVWSPLAYCVVSMAFILIVAKFYSIWEIKIR